MKPNQICAPARGRWRVITFITILFGYAFLFSASTMAKDFAVVTLEGSGEVVFIDIAKAKVVKSAEFKDRASFPRRVAVTPDQSTAIVICEPGYIGFFDTKRMQAVKTLALLSGPEELDPPTLYPNTFTDVAITPDGQTALVTEANENGEIFRIDIETMELTDVLGPIGDGAGRILITSDSLTGLALDEENLHVVNLSNWSFVSIFQPFGITGMEDMDLMPPGLGLIILGQGPGDFGILYLLDTLGIIAQADLPDNTDARQVRVSPDGMMAITTNREHQSITFVSVDVGAPSLVVLDTINVGGTPEGVAFTPDGQTAVVTVANTSQVLIVDVLNMEISATVSTRGLGLAPTGIAIVDR
jgi:DNA-binding beta-propeller fold protein YncE